MKYKKLYIILGIIAIALAVLIFFSIKRESRRITHTFPSTIVIENGTSHDVDTITMILANKIFKLDTINITIANMPIESPSEDKMVFMAFIIKNKYKENHYLIYLSKSLSKSLYKRVLTHELIHMHQYETGDLIQIDDSVIVFKNDTINIKDIKYMDRPQEVDAFNREFKIERELNKFIYE